MPKNHPLTLQKSRRRNTLFGFFDSNGRSHVIHKDDDASPVLDVKVPSGAHGWRVAFAVR